MRISDWSSDVCSSDLLRGCQRTRAIIEAAEASEEDWNTEYLAPILSIRVVDGLDQAIEHINRHGSHHTDSIVSEHQGETRRFVAEVDSARSEEHTSELQSLMRISYAVFCLKKK